MIEFKGSHFERDDKAGATVETVACRRYVDFDCRLQLCHVFMIHIGLQNIDQMTDYVTVWLIGMRPQGIVT